MSESTERVPNTFAAMLPLDTTSAEARALEHESILVEIDWEDGSIVPIMQGDHRTILDEAKGRAHLQSADHENDVLSELAIEYITNILGFPPVADAPDALGDPIGSELQGHLMEAMRRSPQFRHRVERDLHR